MTRGRRVVPGEPCPKGHPWSVGRYENEKKCAECVQVRANRYYTTNKEKVLQKLKETYPEKRQSLLARQKRWRDENPEKQRAIVRRMLSNRDLPAHNARNMRRHADKLQRTPAWADLKEIRRYYDVAAEMTAKTGELWHVDHEIPLRGKLVSGLHVPDNLQLLPAKENCSKQNKFTVL